MAALLLAGGLLTSCDDDEPEAANGPKEVEKTNPMQIYMHYMPWFQSKDVTGYWGYHWKMNNKNPDVIDGNGKREIASHYYPLIGPYDSSDPDVIEYHLLLMKYAGVDGVLIDWYGSHTVNDFKINLTGSNAIIDKVDDAGLKFGIVYEDFTAGIVQDKTTKTDIEAAQADMTYLESNYFSNNQYITINGSPLLLTFGPRHFKQASQWTTIFSGLNEKPKFLPLWNHGTFVGENDNGEFSWVDFTASLSDLESFYNKAPHIEILIGSAYPRFHDFYEEGGVGQSYAYIDFNAGQTLRNTLNKADERNLDHLQLVTWNDFGEGTVIEPTQENEFQCLQIIQEFTGVSYGLDELELIHSYYLKKKALQADAEAKEKLEKVFLHLAALEPDQARKLLDELP
jgi:glycoprotein endo-alpha-1,2-mannosidase